MSARNSPSMAVRDQRIVTRPNAALKIAQVGALPYLPNQTPGEAWFKFYEDGAERFYRIRAAFGPNVEMTLLDECCRRPAT